MFLHFYVSCIKKDLKSFKIVLLPYGKFLSCKNFSASKTWRPIRLISANSKGTLTLRFPYFFRRGWCGLAWKKNWALIIKKVYLDILILAPNTWPNRCYYHKTQNSIFESVILTILWILFYFAKDETFRFCKNNDWHGRNYMLFANIFFY